ncbi:flagellar basal body rod protein FlgC [Calidifontibacillus erzurumensis]|uniref:Flagellar basal-body rod protein FlgC n=1 Tax=Calidifontibacillus erzurumensis TaxID=2741433 RepID=A0A8J8KAT3_9BACI|nr:flagellar basal body rod protein FlgC [Calidifontibacillus erzurumensis]NSL51189.1 flagellar basal body rod protein FlgC [Calidifontibacillus erzurumensis]
MRIFHGMNISASALSAQRFRMDVIASNMANGETTRANFVNGQWLPYRRKIVEFEPIPTTSFSHYLNKAMQDTPGHGVRVRRVVEDETPFKMVYNPDHPDANEEGYVAMPNVDPLKEMIDLMSATRSYEANVTVLNATKGMMMKALEIGK